MLWLGSISHVCALMNLLVNALVITLFLVPEAYDEPDSSEENGDRLEVGTTDLEGYSASKSMYPTPEGFLHADRIILGDNGFFVKAILSQREEDQQQSAPEVKVLAHVRASHFILSSFIKVGFRAIPICEMPVLGCRVSGIAFQAAAPTRDMG